MYKTIFILLLHLTLWPLYAQNPVIHADTEAFKKLIDPDAAIVRIDHTFSFTEGPVYSPDGYLLFSDIPESKIYEWTQDSGIRVYIEPSGNSNGLAFDAAGNLLACEHGTRSLTKRTVKGDKMILASHYNGKKLNSPNDLAVHSSGAIFFTDPPWGLPGNFNSPEKELTFNGVYVLVEGTLYLIDSTLRAPNGIALSPDEKYLYAGNNQFTGGRENMADGERSWFRYTLGDDMTATEKTGISVNPFPHKKGNPDGMKVDVHGNLYCTGPGGLLVFNPKGKYLGRVEFPSSPTNVAFGGADGKTIFVTVRKDVFYFPALVEGMRPGMK